MTMNIVKAFSFIQDVNIYELTINLKVMHAHWPDEYACIEAI